MQLIATFKRFGGKFLISFLTDESGHQVAIVPCDLWRKGKPRKEIGGPPPRPALPEPGIELAEALCKRRRTHNYDVWFNHPEPETDLTAALEASLRVQELRPENEVPEWRVFFNIGGSGASVTTASLLALLADGVVAKHVLRVKRL